MGKWFKRAETDFGNKVDGFSGENKGCRGELSSDRR